MFKHILVSTDGSKLSGKAIRVAARLAGASGAKVTGAYVIAPFVPPVYGEGVVYTQMLSPKRYKDAENAVLLGVSFISRGLSSSCCPQKCSWPAPSA